jgi:hypothetical protein
LHAFQLVDGVNQLPLRTCFIAQNLLHEFVCRNKLSIQRQSTFLPPPADCYLLDHHFLKPAKRLGVMMESGQLRKLGAVFRIPFCDQHGRGQ